MLINEIQTNKVKICRFIERLKLNNDNNLIICIIRAPESFHHRNMKLLQHTVTSCNWLSWLRVVADISSSARLSCSHLQCVYFPESKVTSLNVQQFKTQKDSDSWDIKQTNRKSETPEGGRVNSHQNLKLSNCIFSKSTSSSSRTLLSCISNKKLTLLLNAGQFFKKTLFWILK